jgi:hypothetical protein
MKASNRTILSWPCTRKWKKISLAQKAIKLPRWPEVVLMMVEDKKEYVDLLSAGCAVEQAL